MTGKWRRSARVRAGGLMTPMIDIVFLLLIFFLLSPRTHTDVGYLTTNLPRQGPGCGFPYREPKALEIELRVPAVNSESVAIVLSHGEALGHDFRGLLGRLADLRQRGLPADYPVRIRPWAACRYKWVVRAFDVAVAAGFANIQFTVPVG